MIIIKEGVKPEDRTYTLKGCRICGTQAMASWAELGRPEEKLGGQREEYTYVEANCPVCDAEGVWVR